MRILLSILAVMLPLQICSADLGKPIVWLADDVSLAGHKQVVVHPVSNDTGEKFEFEVANIMTETIRNELIEAGLEVLDPNTSQEENQMIVMENSLIFYTPGNISGRWVGFGGGASICILRTYLMDNKTDEVIGEIIVAKQVSGGGLFSAGAEKSIPVKTAKKAVDQLVKLVEAE